ncbi:hypothetical protein AB0M57_10715 [Streptomyces sp. NPDC051597]
MNERAIALLRPKPALNMIEGERVEAIAAGRAAVHVSQIRPHAAHLAAER